MKIKTYYASTEVLNNSVDVFLEKLPVNLRKRIAAISDIDAKVCSLGGALLLVCASKEFEVDASKVIYLPNGKPYIPGTDFYFSISHTKGYAAISFGKVPSGCDIQMEKDVNFKIAERYFSESEKNFVLSSKDKSSDFFKIWSRKESAYKLKGRSCCTLNNEEGYIFKDHKLNDKLYLCVCAEEGEMANPQLIDLDTVF